MVILPVVVLPEHAVPEKHCQTSSSIVIVSPGVMLQVVACDDPLSGPAAAAHSGGHCERHLALVEAVAPLCPGL